MDEQKFKGCPLCKKSWDRCKCDLEKDFGIKFGSKEEAAWIGIKENAEAEIKQFKRAIIVDEEIIKVAEKQIELEKAKFEKESKK